ncbi:protein OSB3, chloroplastic/mitochondrial-like isoform X2 [Carica papaya]|uniref:protein OSB3, chloroplastic/mitochondrial-like isoform X2 n=1 Tax=Carica papaya TaxID=3649 RepID=UPI000B8D0C58|nr:protein OSB3, chloroplastic/mitochondrial-like isoform X2 [Carica papaya]
MSSLAKALARRVYSSSQLRATPTRERTWVILQQFHSISTTTASRTGSGAEPKSYKLTNTPIEMAETPSWPRPAEIPYQPKVANSVNLIGFVNQTVEFQAASDGKFWAGTVISQRSSSSDSSGVWIPIIFEGDLAHVAACHLKKNDHIHISGQLFADAPPSTTPQTPVNIQVMVHSLNFVEEDSRAKQDFAPWRKASVKRDEDNGFGSWKDLLDNPQEWWDYRDDKKKGLVKPKFPDFKRKDGGHALWLNKIPRLVLKKLETVELDRPVSKFKQFKQQKGDESWKNLVENPNKWWDNRLDKRTEKYPDFKHKETGECLWLSGSPTWVLPKLPSPKHERASAASGEVVERGI